MLYELRWWSACALAACVLFAAYYWRIQPEQEELNALQFERQQLSEQLTALRALAKQKHGDISSTALAKAFATVRYDKMDVLTIFPAAAERQGVSMQSLQLRAPSLPQSGDINLHLRAAGGFAQLSRFALALLQQPNPIFILDFIFRTCERSKLCLEMDILMPSNNIAMLNPTAKPLTFQHTRNPFCQPDNHTSNATAQHPPTLARTPLQQMRMTGLLQQNNQRVALINLPTGETADVFVGMVLGAEQGVVTEIAAEKLVVLVRGERKEIRMALE